jgi:hypothetical protein
VGPRCNNKMYLDAFAVVASAAAVSVENIADYMTSMQPARKHYYVVGV